MFDERLFIVSARAPYEYEYGGFTWFGMGEGLIPDPLSFRESCSRLHQFLLDVRSGYTIDPSRMFLFGFSAPQTYFDKSVGTNNPFDFMRIGSNQ